MHQIPIRDVEDVRHRWDQARARTAERFRTGFDLESPEPEVRYLEIYADAMLETFRGISLPSGWRVACEIGEARLMSPFLFDDERKRRDVYPHISFDREDPAAILSYWIFVSELFASTSWQLTRLIATREEYDRALAGMQEPQIVRALIPVILPQVDFKDDGTVILDVTISTRAGEERIERRRLLLDTAGEFHFHGRDLFAEGRGRVSV